MTSPFVPKQFNNYADTFLMVELIKVISMALTQTGQERDIEILQEVIDYFNPFSPAKRAKTKWENMPPETSYFGVVEETEIRKAYIPYKSQKGEKRTEDSPNPPDARVQNGAILISLRHEANHNVFWFATWELKENYGSFLKLLIEVFGLNGLGVFSDNHKFVDANWKTQSNKRINFLNN